MNEDCAGRDARKSPLDTRQAAEQARKTTKDQRTQIAEMTFTFIYKQRKTIHATLKQTL